MTKDDEQDSRDFEQSGGWNSSCVVA
ncbi:hypothetical protein PIIN_09272 [Serendipita indica DSM 11827]|uniref:Uncharacterized protein n=1 Tax=Serendipita indica (strain DSM 11827) TaxID=1109443 RepID=G4TVE5_SERID|nr:hypothetical protein PIIN_09272 [Serendipita indica DSM 11827]